MVTTTSGSRFLLSEASDRERAQIEKKGLQMSLGDRIYLNALESGKCREGVEDLCIKALRIQVWLVDEKEALRNYGAIETLERPSYGVGHGALVPEGKIFDVSPRCW